LLITTVCSRMQVYIEQTNFITYCFIGIVPQSNEASENVMLTLHINKFILDNIMLTLQRECYYEK